MILCLDREHALVEDDLFVRNGKILNPQAVFFQERELIIDILIHRPRVMTLQLEGLF